MRIEPASAATPCPVETGTVYYHLRRSLRRRRARASPSGKAPASHAGIRGFESRRPLQRLGCRPSCEGRRFSFKGFLFFSERRGFQFSHSHPVKYQLKRVVFERTWRCRHQLPKLTLAGSSPVARSIQISGTATFRCRAFFDKGLGLEPAGVPLVAPSAKC